MNPAEHRVDGRLHLSFETAHEGAPTRLTVKEQRQPLKVVRAFPLPDGGALAHLHNLSGGVLGGDRLEMRVEVGPHATAQLTTAGATRLYRCRASADEARQTTTVRVGAGALLEYLPDPMIPFAGARFRQETRIDLAEGAGLLWWEVVAPGREAHGECFAYDLLESRFDLYAEGRPLALERIRLEPAVRSPALLARLGPYRTFGSFALCQVGRDPMDWLAREQRFREWAEARNRPGQILWGVSAMRAHGLTVRVLGRSGREITEGLTTLWRIARQELFGREAILPRKVY